LENEKDLENQKKRNKSTTIFSIPHDFNSWAKFSSHFFGFLEGLRKKEINLVVGDPFSKKRIVKTCLAFRKDIFIFFRRRCFMD